MSWISAGFVLGGVFLLVVAGDEPESRVAGLFAIVFFGGLGLVYWWISRPRRPRPATAPSSDLDVRAVPDARLFGCDVTLTLPAPFSPASLGHALDELARRPSLRARLAEPGGVATVRELAVAHGSDDRWG